MARLESAACRGRATCRATFPFIFIKLYRGGTLYLSIYIDIYIYRERAVYMSVARNVPCQRAMLNYIIYTYLIR